MVRKFLILLYQPYKWLFYLPFFFINTIFFGVLAVLGSLLFNARVGSFLGGVVWARFNALLVPMLVKVEGRSNIKKEQSYIVMSNHQSVFDIFLVYGWLGIDLKWIMKKELRKIPGLGFGSEKVGHIFLDRSNSRAAMDSLNVAKNRLVNGTSVVIFPEGTRSATGELGSFKRGGFKLALDLQLPILPVTLINTKNIMPTGTLNIQPGKVKMIIHEPIEIQGFTDSNMNEIINRVKERIHSKLPEINPPI